MSACSKSTRSAPIDCRRTWSQWTEKDAATLLSDGDDSRSPPFYTRRRTRQPANWILPRATTAGDFPDFKQVRVDGASCVDGSSGISEVTQEFPMPKLGRYRHGDRNYRNSKSPIPPMNSWSRLYYRMRAMWLWSDDPLIRVLDHSGTSLACKTLAAREWRAPARPVTCPCYSRGTDKNYVADVTAVILERYPSQP